MGILLWRTAGVLLCALLWRTAALFWGGLFCCTARTLLRALLYRAAGAFLCALLWRATGPLLSALFRCAAALFRGVLLWCAARAFLSPLLCGGGAAPGRFVRGAGKRASVRLSADGAFRRFPGYPVLYP